MSLEMSYDTIFTVVDSWEQLRRVPNHEESAGCILFSNLFRKCPECKVLFGFPLDMDPTSEEMQRSKAFVAHAKNMISMLDRALNMLGPDAELLAEILSDLGKKHAHMGVQESYFPYMGEALLEMLKETLGEIFTPRVESEWKVVYAALSDNMVKSMNTEMAVLDSWAKLKKLENYEEVAGGMLFQALFRKCPETKTLFGFPLDLDTDAELILNSRRFKMHSKYFIEMLDKALGMVEAKQIESQMKELGKMHADYGVQEGYFGVMKEALFHTLEECLGREWDSSLQAAWSKLFDRLSREMIAAIKNAKK